MSNLPPGVTGREYAIAGGNATQWQGTCEKYIDEVPVATDSAVFDINHAIGILEGRIIIGNDKSVVERARHYLLGAIAEIDNAPKAYDVQCNFDGPVDAEEYNGTVTWECPRCGAEHEDEAPEPEQDDDDWRDRRDDRY